MICAADLDALRRHRPFDDLEAAHLAKALAWANAPNGDGEHFTASALLLDASGERALLLLHAKLGRWLQPGGHVEASDPTFLAAAIRETLEEAGLAAVDVVSGELFDVDSHPIPERKGAPAHVHHDMRFLLRLPAGVDESQAAASFESKGLKWKPLAEIAAMEDESIARLARKAQALFASARPAKSAKP